MGRGDQDQVRQGGDNLEGGSQRREIRIHKIPRGAGQSENDCGAAVGAGWQGELHSKRCR